MSPEPRATLSLSYLREVRLTLDGLKQPEGLNLAAPQLTQPWGGKASLSPMTVGLSESPELSHRVENYHEPTESHDNVKLSQRGRLALCSQQPWVHRCEETKPNAAYSEPACLQGPGTRPVGYAGHPDHSSS